MLSAVKMHIKSIILDGFKSYGQRTEIHGFDPQFNAITGLNGTGKSNILDSICFVLGITNTSLVRANSLQDLIYKSGQAGVNKATVSLIFDNGKRDDSPPGFEHCKEITVTRQVVMGGKNKYMLNGSSVTQGRIQDLFCSVQLNVNNPHFLIMQGRITKVLNMKPQEILSMIEEAAGTRMYEMKRQAALRMIEKKDAKFKDIFAVVKEEISPKLDHLREQRSVYLEYERLERELQYMMGLYEACRYEIVKKAVVESRKALDKGRETMASFENDIQKNKELIAAIEEEITEIAERAETSGGNRLKEIESELKKRELENVKATAAVKATKESIVSEEKKKKQLQKNLKEDENSLKVKEAEMSKAESVFQALRDNEAADNEAFAASQKKFEALNVGMEVNDEGKAETLQEQLMNAKAESVQASTEIKQATLQLTHCKTDLTAKTKELGANSSDFEKDKSVLQRKESEINALEKKLADLNYSEDRMRQLQENHRSLTQEGRSLQERVETFVARRPFTEFKYADPEPNFDRKRVCGVVCRIIGVKDRTTAVALEKAAGGRLYNVVVDTDVTSKILLKKGRLQQRTTFIPLNKIQASKINDSTVKLAQDLVGAENVCAALSLLTYDRRLTPAMEYIFGNTLICKDINVARQVAFHNRIQKRCVTLDGDVVEPAGVLSGGAREKGGSVLLQIEEIKQFEERLAAIHDELRNIDTEIAQMGAVQERWRGLKNQLELKTHELKLVQQRLKQTTHHQLQEEIDALTATIEELTQKIGTAKEIEARAKAKIKDLDGKMKDSKGYREKQLKDAESEMNKLKTKAEKSQQDWRKREQEYETLVLEISELKKEIETIREQIAASEQEIRNLEEQLQTQTTEAEEMKEVVERHQKELKAERAAIAEKNREAQKKVQKKDQLTTEIANYELEMKKLDHEIKKLETECKTSAAKEKEFAAKCQDRNLKEVERYGEREIADLEKKIRTAQESKNKMSRTVNTKAKMMYEQEEKQFSTLKTRMRIIEQDKKKIELVIVNLEKRKKEAIMLAWEQVTRDFGSIFGTLLPGANAKLDPPENKSVMDGLEVKVSLGGVWKDSLSELSGGQRSLVALSLILAMLLFKPAPLYILDEVDAALDLSHTQNIGNMLKSHFKQSQFVIVSLKDGMFNNANVLFRTRFVDGVSAVMRTVNRSNVG